MKLFFRDLGEGQPPVIIFHGLLGSSENWLTVGRKLSETHRVILPDLRNHGESPHSEIHDYASMAEDIYELFRDNNLSKAIVAGHSMGGKVAMRFALSYPELVEKLVVVDIAPRKYKPKYTSILEALMELETQKIESRQQADEALSKKIKNRVFRQFLLKNLSRDDQMHFKWRLNLRGIYDNMHSIDDDFFTKNTSDIKTIFICGENSDYVMPDDETRIKEVFTDSEIVKIPGAGHWVHADKPEEFYKILTGFIN